MDGSEDFCLVKVRSKDDELVLSDCCFVLAAAFLIALTSVADSPLIELQSITQTFQLLQHGSRNMERSHSFTTKT